MVKFKFLILGSALLAGAAVLFSATQGADQPAVPDSRVQSKRAVSCLGRLVPGERVIRLAGPNTLQGPAIVKELYVRRGDAVKRGAPVARLLNFDISEAQLRQAEAEAGVQARLLDQVRAGEKAGTIGAQEATILRLEAELANAAIVLRRDQELHAQKTISQADFDRSELALRVARQNHGQAVNLLASLKEIRAVDIRVAEARLQAATETVNRLRVELEQTTIRSPLDGVVLEIRTYPGERLDSNPILELGDVANMNIEAEVYVTDIARVRLGAPARARGDGFPGELTGTVTEIGRHVDRSLIFDPDPAAFADKRVIKVRVKLDQGETARALINHQVTVLIAP